MLHSSYYCGAKKHGIMSFLSFFLTLCPMCLLLRHCCPYWSDYQLLGQFRELCDGREDGDCFRNEMRLGVLIFVCPRCELPVSYWANPPSPLSAPGLVLLFLFILTTKVIHFLRSSPRILFDPSALCHGRGSRSEKFADWWMRREMGMGWVGGTRAKSGLWEGSVLCGNIEFPFLWYLAHLLLSLLYWEGADFSVLTCSLLNLWHK